MTTPERIRRTNRYDVSKPANNVLSSRPSAAFLIGGVGCPLVSSEGDSSSRRNGPLAKLGFSFPFSSFLAAGRFGPQQSSNRPRVTFLFFFFYKFHLLLFLRDCFIEKSVSLRNIYFPCWFYLVGILVSLSAENWEKGEKGPRLETCPVQLLPDRISLRYLIITLDLCVSCLLSVRFAAMFVVHVYVGPSW